MAASYSQLPGTMNLTFKAGDTLPAEVDFDVSLSGHTVSAQIVSLVTGQQVMALPVTVTDATAGKVIVSLTGTQTLSIPPATYGWSMAWVTPQGAKRTALSGIVEVVR